MVSSRGCNTDSTESYSSCVRCCNSVPRFAAVTVTAAFFLRCMATTAATTPITNRAAATAPTIAPISVAELGAPVSLSSVVVAPIIGELSCMRVVADTGVTPAVGDMMLVDADASGGTVPVVVGVEEVGKGADMGEGISVGTTATI